MVSDSSLIDGLRLEILFYSLNGYLINNNSLYWSLIKDILWATLWVERDTLSETN